VPAVAKTYLTPRAVRLHLTLAVLLPAFAAMFWWQLHRALAGNGLSWAYTVEWPLFAAYAVFLWWRLLHDDFPSTPKRAKPTAPSEAADLNAYNAYLASLRDDDRRQDGGRAAH
jgi:hypothetical protein